MADLPPAVAAARERLEWAITQYGFARRDGRVASAPKLAEAMAATTECMLAVLEAAFMEQNSFIHPPCHDCEPCRWYWTVREALEGGGDDTLSS